MSHAEKDALILGLFDVLARYEQRLREVEGKVEKTSRNSSQPPSADGIKKGPAKPRQPGEKPLGGQPGHRGATREMAVSYTHLDVYKRQGMIIAVDDDEWNRFRHLSDAAMICLLYTSRCV